MAAADDRVTAGTPRRVTGLRRAGRGAVDVWLDGDPWRRLPEDAVVRAGLAIGTVIDRERARALARERRRAAAMGAAVRALRARDHSSASLRQRLGERGVSDAVGRETIERLQHAGLLDERRAAVARAESLAARGHGDDAVHADLAARGFPDDVARAAVAALAREDDRAAALVARHGRSVRTARLLARRGFGEEIVAEVIASLGDGAIA